MQNRIATMLDKTFSKSFERNDWGARHVKAWRSPRGIEFSLVWMIEGAEAYARDYRKCYESKLGDDGVLGPAWLDIVKGLRTLLNGELGRLDAGTIDSILCDMLRDEGCEDL